MNPILNPYVLIMIAAGMICAGIAAFVWLQRRNNPETIPLVLLLLGITEWIAANLAGMLDPDLPRKMLWAQIEYIGVVSVPLMVLVYVLHHSGSIWKLTAGRLAGLAIIPAATLILAWTNGSSGWIWARYVPYLENGLVFSEKTYGPGFWVYWGYSYLLLLTATVIIVRAMLPSAKIFRWQNVLILIGILAPWAGNLLYVLRLDPLRNLDLTPLAFSITGTMLALGMFRWRLFDIKPVAQAAVIAGMADGVMILDTLDRIVDANSAAQRILGLGTQALVGKPVEEVISSRLPAGEPLPAWEEKNTEIRLSGGGENRIYELSSSPFHETRGALGGKIIFLRDLTDRKRLEAKLRDAERKHAEDLLRQSENKYATLFQNMSVGVIYQAAGGEVIDMNPAAERILGVERGRISGLASIRANLKTIREDGSDYPADEHPSIVALKTGKPLWNQRMGIYFPDEKTYRWINIHAIPQFQPGEEKPFQAFVTFDDVTERKRAEEALLESEQRLASIYDTVGDVVFLLAVEPAGQYRFVSVNASFGKVTGIPSEQVIGRKVSEIIPEPSLGMVLEKYRQAIETKGISRWEEVSEYPTGRLNGEVSVAPVFDAAGKCTHLVGSVHDITERKRAEESLRESEEKFKYVFDNSSVGKSITLPDGAVHPNKAFCELVGYSPDELQNKSWQDLTHPDDIASTQREIDLLISGKKEAARFAKRYLHKNGSVVWADVSTSLRRDDSGKPLYFMTTLIDITDRKRAEEKLRYQASLLESANDAIVVSDAEFRLTDWNAAAEKLYGWKAEEVLGRNGVEIIRTEWPAAEAEEMRRTIAEQGHWRGEAVQQRKDGTRIPVEVSSMVLRDPGGSITGYISLNRNISDRKKAEEEIALLAKFPSENPNIVLRLARDGTLLFANNASKELMAEWGTAIGKPVPKFWRDAAADALAHEKRSSVETQSGGRWYSFLIAPIAEAGYVNMYGRDETERKRAEEALRESETNFRTLADNAGEGILIAAAGGIHLYANRASEEITGYGGEELLRLNARELAHPDEIPMVMERLQKRLAGENPPSRYETAIINKQGQKIPVEINSNKTAWRGQPADIVFITDISARKQAEETLRQSEEKYRHLFQNAQVGMYRSKLDGSAILAVNRKLCEIFEYSEDEMIGNPATIRWADPSARERMVADLRNTGALLNYEIDIQTKNGNIRTCSVSIQLNPELGYIEGSAIDITERKRAEEALRESEKRLREAQEMAHLGFWTWDVKMGAVEWSEEVFKIFCLDPKEFTPQIDSILALSPWPEDHQRDQELIQRAIETRSPGSYEQKFFRPDKSIGHYYSTFQGYYDEKGDLISIVGTVLDITERKRAEEALRDSEEKYRLIADNADDWIYLTAPDRRLLYSSPSCERLTGYAPKEFTDDPELLLRIVHPDDRKVVESHNAESQGEPASHSQEFRILTRAGEIRWISHSCVPIHTIEGKYAGRRGTNRDITERKQAEETLQVTLADLERSNADLEQFAYVASHDLQEPLRMVSSFTQLLGQRYKGRLDKDADEFIGYAVDGASHMQRLINDLLSYSRVGTRGKPPAPIPADLALDRALENLKLVLEENQAEVKREPLPTVTVDDVQLIQVFQNLIANAIKFRGEDPPRIFIGCQARDSEWVFSVRDNGIGIDPQYLERIFIIFQRLHPRGKYPGTGIGLAICRKIIQRHSGRIWAESEPGNGSTFFFTMPKTGEK